MFTVIHLNGFPGSGKLTIAKELAEQIGDARVLDNHSAYIDASSSLFGIGTPEWMDTVAEMRDVAFAAASRLPPPLTLIMTNVLYDLRQDFRIILAVSKIAEKRGCSLTTVNLTVLPEAHRERLIGRVSPNKLRDWDQMEWLLDEHRLLGPGSNNADFWPWHHLDLDTTAHSAATAAMRIAQWVKAKTNAVLP